jgi:hypothetical protein
VREMPLEVTSAPSVIPESTASTQMADILEARYRTIRTDGTPWPSTAASIATIRTSAIALQGTFPPPAHFGQGQGPI